jgi:hypothetical protein
MRHARGPIAISLLALLGPLAAEDTAPPAAPPQPSAATAPAPSATAPTTLVGTITALAPATHSLNVRPKTGDAISVATDDHTVITVDGDAATYADLKMDQKVTVVREGDRTIAVAAISAADVPRAKNQKGKKKKNE